MQNKQNQNDYIIIITLVLNIYKCILHSESIIIIMVISKCYFSREHIDLSLQNGVKIQIQIKSTVHDAK